jgi:hypothetical protein
MDGQSRHSCTGALVWPHGSSSVSFVVRTPLMGKGAEEVNEGEDKGRTEMQKVTMFFPFFRPRGCDAVFARF